MTAESMDSSHNDGFYRPRTFPWFRLVDPLLLVTSVWCLFSFKIFVVKFGEAGLRPDDLLLLLSMAGLMLTRRLRRTPISLPIRLYLVYAGIQLLSTCWNAFTGRVNFIYSLVFVIRILEYLCFYFIGYSLVRTGYQFMRIVTWYFWTLCAVVPLQMLGILPVPGAFARERASGNTNGPYELAIVAGFFLCYLAYRKRSMFKGFLSLVMIVLTASRITLVAAIVSLLHVGFTRAKSKAKTLAIVIPVAVILASIYALAMSGVLSIDAFNRIQNSKSYGIADIRAMYTATDPVSNATEYFNGPFEDLNGIDVNDFNGDASGLIRFTRWIVLVKSSMAHWDSIILGMGPSFGSAAVDGYFTRCFVETGISGLIVFLAFVISLLMIRKGSNWYFREYVVIMVISALFIDIFLSYKSMMLLWLWHGMNQYLVPAEEKIAVAEA